MNARSTSPPRSLPARTAALERVRGRTRHRVVAPLRIPLPVNLFHITLLATALLILRVLW